MSSATEAGELLRLHLHDLNPEAAKLWATLGAIEMMNDHFRRAILAAEQREREACAQVCIDYPYEWKIAGQRYAQAIRNRGSSHD